MSNDDTTYTVTYGSDGEPIDVNGTQAVTGDVQTRMNPETGNLEVKIEFAPIGDDALYAGRLTAHFVLTKPDVPAEIDPDPVNRATKGAEWAKHLIESACESIPEVLPMAFSKAARDASGQHHGRIDAIVTLIATLAIATFDGDRDKAKDACRRLMRGEVVEEWGPRGLDVPPDMSDEQKARMLDTLNEAIDGMADSLGQ